MAVIFRVRFPYGQRTSLVFQPVVLIDQPMDPPGTGGAGGAGQKVAVTPGKLLRHAAAIGHALHVDPLFIYRVFCLNVLDEPQHKIAV